MNTTRHSSVREGIIAGLIGAVTVAVWFFILDAARGQPFFTPAALGSGLIRHAADMGDVEISAITVGGYTVVHVAAFVALGLLAALLIHAAQRRPVVLLGLILLVVTLETLLVGFIALAASWLLGRLAWWSIGIANVLSAAAMGWYLIRSHPHLREQIMSPLEEEEAHGS